MDFKVEKQPMKCGSHEAEKRRFRMVTSKTGRRWMIAIQDNAADNIYAEGGPGSQGFGGRTITFTLENGEEVALKGPWHGNSEGLYKETGEDIRDKHLTFAVISMFCERDGWTTTMKDVLHQDEKPIIGHFYRGHRLAKKMAIELGEPVFCYSQSSGGSSGGQVKPDEEYHWEK